MKTTVQKIGRLLSSMVMPNIGAFIAWGFLTALFIPTGWLPNEAMAKMVGPIITYLLPVLIGYKGGEIVGGQRGGVVGAVATMGVIVGADVPMFMGAMIIGPCSGLLIKKFDQSVKHKIPAGFEMLINNFSAGIIGMFLAMAGFVIIGPVVSSLSKVIEHALSIVVNAHLLPLASIFIEPGKVLFLNNAMNHGILSPLGAQEAKEAGKSIFFLLETNPGPGLGILIAYWMFAKGSIKQSAPGAIIIHFLGGIHEIYFPYILMKPKLIFAAIAGGATGVFTYTLFHAGLIAPPSPGSVFMLLAMTPKGDWVITLLGIAAATVVSFLVAAVLIKHDGEEITTDSLTDAKNEMSSLKYTHNEPIRKIVFACDAGMGSSAMGASTLRNKINKLGMNIEVVNEAIENIPKDAQIVIAHKNLMQRAKEASPFAEHIAIDDFLNTPAYDLLVERVKKLKATEAEQASQVVVEEKTEVLQKKNILLNLPSVDKHEAIRMAGRLLVESGYVQESYIEAMIQREEDLTTYIGNGVAIPHGVGEAKKKILKTGICILQFPNGVAFDDEFAYIIIGIAGIGNEHISILSNLATVMEEMSVVEQLSKTDSVDFVYDCLCCQK